MKMGKRPAADESYMAGIADSACLRLTSEELRQFARQTEAMLRMLDRMRDPEWNSEPEREGAVGVEELREDVPGHSLGRSDLLNAAVVQDGVCFVSPPVRKGDGTE